MLNSFDLELLVGDDLFEPAFLFLEILQTAYVTDLHAAVLGPPAVDRVAADTVLADQVLYRHAGLGLAGNPDDLFFCVALASHRGCLHCDLDAPLRVALFSGGRSDAPLRVALFSGGRSVDAPLRPGCTIAGATAFVGVGQERITQA